MNLKGDDTAVVNSPGPTSDRCPRQPEGQEGRAHGTSRQSRIVRGAFRQREHGFLSGKMMTDRPVSTASLPAATSARRALAPASRWTEIAPYTLVSVPKSGMSCSSRLRTTTGRRKIRPISIVSYINSCLIAIRCGSSEIVPTTWVRMPSKCLHNQPLKSIQPSTIAEICRPPTEQDQRRSRRERRARSRGRISPRKAADAARSSDVHPAGEAAKHIFVVLAKQRQEARLAPDRIRRQLVLPHQAPFSNSYRARRMCQSLVISVTEWNLRFASQQLARFLRIGPGVDENSLQRSTQTV